MPTKKQLHRIWETEFEFPQTRREDDPAYVRPEIKREKMFEPLFENEETKKEVEVISRIDSYLRTLTLEELKLVEAYCKKFKQQDLSIFEGLDDK